MLLWLHWNRSTTLSYGFLNVKVSKEDFSNNFDTVDVVFLDASCGVGFFECFLCRVWFSVSIHMTLVC